MNQSSSINQKNTQHCNKLQKRIRHHTEKAVADFNLIEDDDKVMVCLSGGNVTTLWWMYCYIFKNVAPIFFSIIAVNLD